MYFSLETYGRIEQRRDHNNNHTVTGYKDDAAKSAEDGS